MVSDLVTRATVFKCGVCLVHQRSILVLQKPNLLTIDAGQTASGKTHTMSGAIEDETMMGVLPRTVKRLFQLVAQSERNLECVCSFFFCVATPFTIEID